MDFTLTTYRSLLTTLQKRGFLFNSFKEVMFAENRAKAGKVYSKSGDPSASTTCAEASVVTIRHDVDLLPQNSLTTASIENSLNIKATYYFRVVPESNQPKIIRQIANLGHEIGYHYEDLTLTNGNMEKAWEKFQKNLEYFRQFYPVSTICMHGSPRSKYDSKDLWKKYDYRKLGIIGEPYFDLDFDEWFYLTDTGRRWDGWKSIVRDKLPQQEKWIQQDLVFHSTHDIIKAAEAKKLPDKIMITVHPQRWTYKTVPWVKELLMQAGKNMVKRWFFVEQR